MSLPHLDFKTKPALGGWITIPAPQIAEIFASSPLDFIAIDREHSAISVINTEHLIRVCTLLKKPTLIRVSHNDHYEIKRVMDFGASGIIVPMVNTPAEVDQAAQAMQYPPRGYRGMGLARAQLYGNRFEEYLSWLSEKSTLIVQIEHKAALPHLPDIFNHPEVDGIMIGPYDLSASLEIPGQFQHPLYQQALAQIKEVAKKAAKPCGIHVIEPNPNELKLRITEGYQFSIFSFDMKMITHSLNSLFQTLFGSKAPHVQ